MFQLVSGYITNPIIYFTLSGTLNPDPLNMSLVAPDLRLLMSLVAPD